MSGKRTKKGAKKGAKKKGLGTINERKKLINDLREFLENKENQRRASTSEQELNNIKEKMDKAFVIVRRKLGFSRENLLELLGKSRSLTMEEMRTKIEDEQEINAARTTGSLGAGVSAGSVGGIKGKGEIGEPSRDPVGSSRFGDVGLEPAGSAGLEPSGSAGSAGSVGAGVGSGFSSGSGSGSEDGPPAGSEFDDDSDAFFSDFGSDFGEGILAQYLTVVPPTPQQGPEDPGASARLLTEARRIGTIMSLIPAPTVGAVNPTAVLNRSVKRVNMKQFLINRQLKRELQESNKFIMKQKINIRNNDKPLKNYVGVNI